MTAPIPRDIIDTLHQARDVVDRISFDENGAIVAGQYRGGNGGLISRETLIAVDSLRKQLEALGLNPASPGDIRRPGAL